MASMPMYTTSPLSISTGQYEQSMLTGAVNKRISIFQYIKRAHEMGEHWCDTFLCSREDFERLYSEQKLLGKKSGPLKSELTVRTTNYMILGMSVSGLLELQGNAVDYLKALNQLLHEYEYHSTHEPGSLSGKPKMRNFFKPVKGAPTRRSEGNTDSYFSGESSANPSTYTYLNLVNTPFEPDFIQTFCALLAILVEAYQRLLTIITSPSECTQSLVVTFQKVDEKIKKNVLGWVVKEIDDYCRTEAQTELDNLEKLISIAPPL